jgi:hypothetical protein
VSACENFSREFQVLRRAFARQWLAQPSVEIALGPPDKSLVFVEKGSQPRVIVLSQEVRDDNAVRGATVDQMIG